MCLSLNFKLLAVVHSACIVYTEQQLPSIMLGVSLQYNNSIGRVAMMIQVAIIILNLWTKKYIKYTKWWCCLYNHR